MANTVPVQKISTAVISHPLLEADRGLSPREPLPPTKNLARDSTKINAKAPLGRPRGRPKRPSKAKTLAATESTVSEDNTSEQESEDQEEDTSEEDNTDDEVESVEPKNPRGHHRSVQIIEEGLE